MLTRLYRRFFDPVFVGPAVYPCGRTWVSKVKVIDWSHLTSSFYACRTRMGIAFSLVAVALLVGSPIEGALMRNGGGVYAWSKSIIFCGVCVAELIRSLDN
jgi:hypothetical protein